MDAGLLAVMGMIVHVLMNECNLSCLTMACLKRLSVSLSLMDQLPPAFTFQLRHECSLVCLKQKEMCNT